MKKIIGFICIMFLLISCTDINIEYKKSSTYIDVSKIKYNTEGEITFQIVDKDTLKSYKIINGERKGLEIEDNKEEKYYYGLNTQGKYYLYNGTQKDGDGGVASYAFSNDKKHFAFNTFDINLGKWIFVKDGEIIDNKYYVGFDFDGTGNLVLLQNFEGYENLTLVQNGKAIVKQNGIVDMSYSDDKKYLAYVVKEWNEKFNETTKEIESPFVYYVYVNGKKSKKFNRRISDMIFSPDGTKIAVLETEKISSTYKDNKYSVIQLFIN